jgi:hypothetical protein
MVSTFYKHYQNDTELKRFPLLSGLAADSNKDSSVSTRSGYGFDGSTSIAGRGRDISLLYNDTTYSGTQHSPFPLGPASYLVQGKVSEHEATRPLPHKQPWALCLIK